MSLTIFGINDYLLIKLVNVIVGLPLGLDVDGMTLNTVSCGHDWLSTRRTKKKTYRQTLRRTKSHQRHKPRKSEVGEWWRWGEEGE